MHTRIAYLIPESYIPVDFFELHEKNQILLSKFITVLEGMRNTNQYRVCPPFGGDYNSTSVE
jgi:hypothetical protein